MLYRHGIGGALYLIMAFQLAVATGALSATPEEVRRILQESRSGGPTDPVTLVRRLEPLRAANQRIRRLLHIGSLIDRVVHQPQPGELKCPIVAIRRPSASESRRMR